MCNTCADVVSEVTVGKECADDGVCVAGATCKEQKCTCDNSVSNPSGLICGRLLGSTDTHFS